MSEERIPSEQQLSMLRARLVRFQLHAEAAGLWPGAVPFAYSARAEAIRAARELLLLCRDAGQAVRSTLQVSNVRTKQQQPAFGLWSGFWFTGIRHVLQVLDKTLVPLIADWMINSGTVRTVLMGHNEGFIDTFLSDRSWQLQVRLLLPSEDAVDRGCPKLVGSF